MDRFARALKERRHRMLREPIDLEVWVQIAQRAGDREIASGVAKTDRRGEIERAPVAAQSVADDHGRLRHASRSFDR